jgi:transposase
MCYENDHILKKNLLGKEKKEMRKKVYEISESAEQLFDMMKKEEKGRFRDRIRLLWFLKTGEAENMTRAAELCGISYPTALEWFGRYEIGGIGELLCLKTVTGQKCLIPEDIMEELKRKLSEPDGGFGSYEEIRIWLYETYNLDIKYKTLHRIVRYRLGAKLKCPRPSHTKKDEEKVREFKESLPEIISEISDNTKDPLRIFSCDESRFGLITSLGKKITLPGVRPIGQMQRIFENYQIYGATEVRTGEKFFLEFPSMNTDCFQIFLDNLSESFRDTMNIVLVDNAGIHKAKRLEIPENISLVFLPAYSPEPNPIERFWQYVKKDIKGKIFSDLLEMKDFVADILKKCSAKTIASITGFSYILDAIGTKR